MRFLTVAPVVLLLSSSLCISEPDHTGSGLKFQITQVAKTGLVRLDMVPSSGQSVRIWKKENSWGAARWRVLVSRNGHVDAYFQNPGQIFTTNVPSYVEIGKDDRLALELDLNAGNWCGLGQCSRWDQHGIAGQEVRFQSGDTVVVVYEVPPSPEARDLAVWWGVGAATTTVP